MGRKKRGKGKGEVGWMGCFVQSHFSQRAFEIKVAKPNTYPQEQKMGMHGAGDASTGAMPG